MVRHFEEELKFEKPTAGNERAGGVLVYRSIQSLIEKNEEASQQVLQNETRIDRMEIDIDELATNLLARVPMATDLRFITAAIKINNDLGALYVGEYRAQDSQP